MIFKSLKWRLQIWHALMLVLVLAGFGFTAYRLENVSRFERIDRDLESRAMAISGALRREGPPRPGPGDGFRPGDPRRPRPPRDGSNDRNPRGRPGDEPPPPLRNDVPPPLRHSDDP